MVIGRHSRPYGYYSSPLLGYTAKSPLPPRPNSAR